LVSRAQHARGQYQRFDGGRPRAANAPSLSEGIWPERDGIIAVSNPDYDPKQWWRYSDGVREVTGESIAYIYTKFFFYPSASLAENERLRYLVDNQQ